MCNVKSSTVTICFALVVFFVFVFPIGSTVKAEIETNTVPVYLLEMPKEYINYTICQINGKLWAKVDGTYPINKIKIDPQNGGFSANDIVSTFTGDILTMFYPTPPGTTNISIKVNEKELNWCNYTQTFPEALHFTAVGNWPIIECTIYPVLDEFTLKIHYEHPIQQKNGNFTFLYDLNINPYLSSWSNKSTANFVILFKTGYSELQVNRVTVNGELTPVEYVVTKNIEGDEVSFQVVSEYSKKLLGDLLITFNEENQADQSSSGFLGSSLASEQFYAVIGLVALAAIMVALVRYRQKTEKHKANPVE